MWNKLGQQKSSSVTIWLVRPEKMKKENSSSKFSDLCFFRIFVEIIKTFFSAKMNFWGKFLDLNFTDPQRSLEKVAKTKVLVGEFSPWVCFVLSDIHWSLQVQVDNLCMVHNCHRRGHSWPFSCIKVRAHARNFHNFETVVCCDTPRSGDFGPR